ncbi:hypothetical protein [Streptomyces sp. NPDC093094]
MTQPAHRGQVPVFPDGPVVEHLALCVYLIPAGVPDGEATLA